jgi:hypothetical protein
MEQRFLEIKSCKECPFKGVSITGNGKAISIFCTSPDNMDIEKLQKIEIHGKLYPIVELHSWSMDCEIPYWCKLPKRFQNEI